LGKRTRRAKEARAAAARPPAPPLAAGPLPTAAGPAAAVAAAVAALALAVYLRTLAPTVTLVDSGELALAARDLGVAHPPGTPLWVLLAHLATLVPWSNVAARVAAASAVFAALASGLMVLVAREALLAVFNRPGSMEAATVAPRWRGLVAPAVAGLCFAFSRSLWSYATIVEVYTLNVLLILAVLFLVLRWSRRGGDGWLHASAVIFGLGLGVHHVTVALTLPALAVLVYRAAGADFFRSRRLLLAAAAATLALVAVYSYLPWAASRRPVFDWGDPSTLQRIVWHITGRQYQAFFDMSTQAASRELGTLLRLTARQFGPPFLPLILILALAGAVRLWQRDRRMAVALAVLLGTNVAFGLAYVIGEDKDAYYLPSFLALALLASFGAQALLGRVHRAAPVTAAGLLILAAALPLASGYAYADRSRYFIAEDYVTNALRGVAQGGMLLTGDWQLYSPLLYLREVEGQRRDVVAMDILHLRRSWYFETLDRQFPRAVDAARPQVEAYVTELRAWEQDPGLYARSPELTRRINDRFLAMLKALVDTHPGPVYATRDVVLPAAASDPEVARTLIVGHPLVPRGLVFELAKKRPEQSPPAVPLEMRGLFDGSLRFEPDDVVSLRVKPVYLGMIAARGAYLAVMGDRAGAETVFRQTLALDPGFAPARAALDTLRAMPPSR
jgi:hypothetical protein